MRQLRYRRHYRNPDRGDSSIWLDFMRACLRIEPDPERAATAADIALKKYRQRFPEPPPDPDEDELEHDYFRPLDNSQ